MNPEDLTAALILGSIGAVAGVFAILLAIISLVSFPDRIDCQYFQGDKYIILENCQTI